MAVMKDHKPTKYTGEQRTWEMFEKNLPQEIICYNHREINGREFDFCLLIQELGLVIIEVKGWHVADIERIASPDEIYLRGNEKPEGSPKKQARGYRFDLVNQFNQRYHIDPLVLDMVCYPFLSERDYHALGLDTVSEPEFTLFSHDLENQNALSRKLVGAYHKLSRAASDKCKGEVYDICRRHFEPDYVVKPPMPTAVPYSCLSVYTESLTIAEINKILQSYFEGTKQTVFVYSEADLTALARNLTELLRQKHLCIHRGNLAFGEQSEEIAVKNGKVSAFQFEAICAESSEFTNGFNCYNGQLTEEQLNVLSEIRPKSLFNIDQYRIEHAPVDRDIQVRAGAGTGKTYSMVSRIAYLCHPASNSGVFAAADEIAMLTFTSDAATNMKTRLKQMFMNYFVLTGNTKYLELVSDIEKMRISTIHSFANEVFQNTSLTLGIGTNFTTISGNYDHGIVFSRVFDAYLMEKNQESPLFFEDLPMSIYDLQKYLQKLPQLLYNKGCDVKEINADAFGRAPEELPFLTDMIQKVVIPAEQEYAQFLVDNNAVHLSQYMINLRKCIDSEAFNTNLFRFKYVFIDEFQDTDDAQIAAFLAMQEKMDFRFFIVGDLKQSIYRFRGATMDAFRRMGCEEENWLEYCLTINYRTDARLLERFDDAFSSMGGKHLLPYESSKDSLVGASVHSAIPAEQLVTCYDYCADDVKNGEFYNTLFAEIEKQKKAIEAAMEQGNLSLPERTIAILTRTNYQIDNIAKEAKKRDIQMETTSGGDLYRLPCTLDLCKLTAALCNPYHPTYLFDLICSNNVKVSFDPAKLLGLPEEEKVSEMIKCLDVFYQARLNKTWKNILDDVQHKPILMMLRTIYEGTQPWKNESRSYTRQAFYCANYDLLFEELSKMNKRSYLTLDAINEALHIAIQTGEERGTRTPDQEQDGVRILCTTVHKSKGLEYGTVILPFTERDGTGSTKGLDITYVDDKVGYCITENQQEYANSYYNFEEEKTETLMEESRILYVALTRAINRFVWFRKNGTGAWSWGGLLEDLSDGN